MSYVFALLSIFHISGENECSVMHVDSGCSASFLHTWKTQQSCTIIALCVAARTSEGIWF